MTLEEAIRHAEEKAKCEGKCGEDHAQLATWLRELQERRVAESEKRTEERAKTHACDSVNRQAAIDAVSNMLRRKFGIGGDLAEITLAELPSAQPERMRGTWIIKDNPGTGWYRVTCSECGEDVTSTAPCIGFYPNAKVTWDYCPNCGADMREVSE